MSQLFGMDNILSSLTGKYDNKVNKGAEKVASTKDTIGKPELSETASKYYEELKAKYGDMEFVLVDDAQKERIEAQQEEKRAEKKEDAKQAKSPENLTTISASSIEELIKKLQDAKYEAMSDQVQTPQEKLVGQSFDFTV